MRVDRPHCRAGRDVAPPDARDREAKRRDAARLDRSRDLGGVWAGLQTILDGFAIFDKDHRLVLANRAYLSVLKGVTEVASGITYDRASVMQAPTRRVRVLAAEDNATNRFVLTKLLEPLDVDLRVVERGAGCLAEAMRDPPDLMLTDISMPDMDGLEMTRRLRAWEVETGRPPLRVGAMTAHALAADIEKILSAGLDRVLTGPLKRTLLIEECAAATNGSAQVTLAAAPASDTSPA